MYWHRLFWLSYQICRCTFNYYKCRWRYEHFPSNFRATPNIFLHARGCTIFYICVAQQTMYSFVIQFFYRTTISKRNVKWNEAKTLQYLTKSTPVVQTSMGYDWLNINPLTKDSEGDLREILFNFPCNLMLCLFWDSVISISYRVILNGQIIDFVELEDLNSYGLSTKYVALFSISLKL